MKHLHIVVGSDRYRMASRREEIKTALLCRGRPFHASDHRIRTDDGLCVRFFQYSEHTRCEGIHGQRVTTFEFYPFKSSSTNPDGSGESVTWQRWQEVLAPYDATELLLCV